MTYRETLFFISQCLTIRQEFHNKTLVEQTLKNKVIDWDSVVKISTAHYVFPALYWNFKSCKFLHYLPEDLVNYMVHIFQLNRNRNIDIVKQAQDINSRLLENNITPIFLKGTGNLIAELYDDIGERMVGDIDFLVSKRDFDVAIRVLNTEGYSKVHKAKPDTTIFDRHYPKLVKKGGIASVEVHYKMINDDSYFNYEFIQNSLKKTADGLTTLSYQHMTLLTCYNKQINDKGQWFKTIALRNAYDLYLLSKHCNISKVLNNLKTKNSAYLLNFLASSCVIFNHPESLSYIETLKTEHYLKLQNLFINNPKKNKFNRKKWKIYFLIHSRFFKVYTSFFSRKHRVYLIERFLTSN